MDKVLFLFFFLLISCSRSDKAEFELSLQHVRWLLTEKNCDHAISIMRDLKNKGNHSANPEFLSLYSASLACRGNYDEINFFKFNLPRLKDVDESTFYEVLASFYNAEDNPGTSEYSYLDDAANVLLYPGNITSTSHEVRRKLFDSTSASNLNAQLLYMIITQVSRYVHYYGNMGLNASGKREKGSGVQGNICFTDYTTTEAQTLRASFLSPDNPCNGDDQGHTAMNTLSTQRTSVMCQGITKINNFFDLLSNLAFSGINSSELQDLQLLNRSRCGEQLMNNPAICTTKDLEECETLPLRDIESLMIIYFESLTNEAS